MSDKIPWGCKKFRPAILPIIVFMLMVGLPGLLCWALLVDGLKLDPRALLVGAVFMVLVSSMIGAPLLSIFYAAGVSVDGIYGHSFWGIRRLVRWSDIAVTKRFRLLNLPWLRIYSPQKRVTWVALFQPPKSEFWQEVRQFAPSGSPVLNYLR